jgi:hypothetical protein
MVIALFVTLNFALSTVSGADLGVVLPDTVARRLGIRKEAISSGGH